MLKRLLALSAALVMLATCTVGALAAEIAPEPPMTDTLVVGHTTMMNGNFFSEIWGNNTADIDVRSLLHEYPLVSWTSDGDYQVNEIVVNTLEIINSGNGDKTFNVTLQPDLRYSDGSAITAKDYVFSYLLMSSPQIMELSGVAAARDYIQGALEYQAGEDETISGVRLLGDYAFSVIVPGEFLPYYFELNYINISPLPYSVLVPGSDIADNGEGAYIVGEFTADVLRETILNDETGYLSHPAVTSGPYKLVKYDSITDIAEFEINPFYKGNYEGQIPAIPKLIFREVKNETIIAELNAGTVDLVNKVTEGQVIDDGLLLAAGGAFAAVPYPRTGAGFIAVSAEREITSSVQMRQALAYCIDYDLLPLEFLKGYGERVYGYYGLGQWMVAERQEQLEQMQPYTLDLEKAASLIAADGWTLNSKGEPFDPQNDTFRYRETDGELKQLTLVLAVTEKNEAAYMMAAMLSANFAKVGGKLQTMHLKLNRALRQYYRQDRRQFDLLFQGTNFSYLFDPENTYRVGNQYQGTVNTSGVQDPELERLASEITKHQPGDRNGYLNRWMDFQRYWSEVLPMIPLYSNIYHDLFTADLVGYFPQFYWNWGTAILYATLNR